MAIVQKTRISVCIVYSHIIRFVQLIWTFGFVLGILRSKFGIRIFIVFIFLIFIFKLV